MRKLLRWMDVVAWGVVVGLALRFGAHTGIWCAGLILAAVCLPLWLMARLQLGEAFTLKPEARTLVTRGLYSRIRHPIYVFGCGAYFGALLALQIWPILAAWLALTPIELLRARREERVLVAAFGKAYEDHRKRTWF
jgi:protein-S-isoprenylcysteine O-methyltransferase Ste14